MALTQGQQQAADWLQIMQGRSASDYYTANTQDMIMADPVIQDMLQSSEGSYDSNQIQKIIAQRTAAMNTDAHGLAQSTYDDYLKQANDSVAWWAANPNGHDLGTIGNFIETVLPIVVGGAFLGGATGLFDGAAAGAAGASGAGAGIDAGLTFEGLGGALPINTAALGTGAADFAGLGGAAAGAGAAGLGGIAAGGTGAGEAASGLGGMVGVEGGAPAVVTVGAPTTGGLGVGAGALGAGLGAGAILGSNPSLPVNSGALQQTPQVNEGGTNIPDSSLPPVVVPPLANHPELGAVNPVADGAANLPYTPPITPGGGTGGTPSTGTGGVPGLGSIPSWLQGLLPLLGGNVDRIKAQQDADWWKSQLDTLQGMYKPGTQEATLMEQQMNAKDAAAGRNSQYGIRATDLAANLAGKRAGIMTSAGYQNMANAYRGRSSQDLNGLFSAMGNSGTQNLLGSLGGTISSLFNQ